MRLDARVRNLIQDGRLSSADVDQLGQLAQQGVLRGEDVAALGARYADALDAGTGARLTQLAARLGAPMRPEAPIADLSGAPGVLNGLVTLSPAENRRHAGVRTVQRALMALANRTERPGYALPNWGADGDFGAETKAAVARFQADHGLEVTGRVDGRTAKKLDAALRATNVPAVFGPGGADTRGPRMAKAAEFLVREHAHHYGVDDPWFNLDPNHALPANVRLGGLEGTWKCNLFACNTVYKAGFEPPYYGNRGRGEYPNANQLYKWSNEHARRYGNPVHFELGGELKIEDTEKAVGAARTKKALAKLLSTAKPGDMIIVDHRGDEIADGGHCRVVMDNKMKPDGTGYIACAQASRDAGKIRDEHLSRFTGEETLWILRPSKARAPDIA